MRLSFASRYKSGWLTVYPSAGQVDLILVEMVAGRPRVSLLASEPVGDGLADCLTQLRKRLRLSEYRCIALMAGGEFQLLQVDTPAVPRPEWKEALRWKLKDMLDFPVEEAVFDVLDIPTEEFAPSRPRSVYVVAARRSLVAGRIAPYADAGLPLAVVDIPEIAQRNVAALFEEENRGIACIAFDETSALLTVSFHGELYASRRIDVALSQLVAANEERRAQIFERVALEAQRTLDAFDRQYSFMTVSKLIVAQPVGITGFMEALSANLYIKLEEMDMGKVVDFADEGLQASPAEQSRLLYAIGAALRGDAS